MELTEWGVFMYYKLIISLLENAKMTMTGRCNFDVALSMTKSKPRNLKAP